MVCRVRHPSILRPRSSAAQAMADSAIFPMLHVSSKSVYSVIPLRLIPFSITFFCILSHKAVALWVILRLRRPSSCSEQNRMKPRCPCMAVSASSPSRWVASADQCAAAYSLSTCQRLPGFVSRRRYPSLDSCPASASNISRALSPFAVARVEGLKGGDMNVLDARESVRC